MSFLSLAKGDPAARNLLQRAIRARYGVRPLSLDSLRLNLTRRDKGPLGLPAKVFITASIVAPEHWRWEQVHKLFGIPYKTSLSSFDSCAFFEHSGKSAVQTEEPQVVAGLRCRVWSEIASLLTPLTSNEVILKTVDEQTFRAYRESQPDNVVTIRLNEDDTVAAVEIPCYRPADKRELLLSIQPTGGLQTLEGFTLPKQIVYQWDGSPSETFDVVHAEANPQIPLTEFTIS
jgi:hypothetical protein